MQTYKINRDATNSFDGTTLSSLSSFSISQDSETSSLASDGHVYVEKALVDNVIYNITVNGYDNSQANIAAGSTGILILNAEGRGNGSEETDPVDPIVYTFAIATLDNVSENINHNGNSDVTYTFRAVSSDGSTSPLVVS